MTIPILYGPYGSGALAHAAAFADLGANACWFHMFDADAFETCARHRIAACVELKTFRADFEQFPELRPIGVDGKPIRYGSLVQGVCLSQHDFVQHIEEELLAGLKNYAPAGIWLDYLSYAGWFEQADPDLQESCFCPACVSNFCEASGLDVRSPAEILAEHATAWERYKCERIAAFGMHYASLIKQQHPTCVVGAYMCPWAPDEYGHALTRIFAQDYRLLAHAIDVFTPLIYATKSGRPTTWGRSFLEQAHHFVPQQRPVQLILDALDGPQSLYETAQASTPSWGLQVFGGAQIFSDASLRQSFNNAVTQIHSRITQ